MANGSYDDVFSTAAGKLLAQMIEACPDRNKSEDGADATAAAQIDPPWTIGVCLDNGTLEIVWDANVSSLAVCDSCAAAVSLIVEFYAEGHLRETKVGAWDYFPNTTAIGRLMDDSARCQDVVLSYRLKFALGNNIITRTEVTSVAPPSSAPVFVLPSGTSASGGCGSLAAPCRDLKAALGDAAEHRTLVVFPGTYSGSSNVGLTFENRSLSIRGIGGAEQTRLACTEGSFGLWFAQSVVSLSGVTIEGCLSHTGAGLGAERTALNLTDVILTRNEAYGDGATGGGLHLSDQCNATITRSQIFGNRATKYGAGVYIHHSTVRMVQTQVYSNKLISAGRGTGVSIFADSEVHMIDASLSHNEGFFAGAIMAENSILSVVGSHIENNTANYGGGLVLVSAFGAIEDCHVQWNQAAQYGGAVLLESAETEVRQSTFASNTARDGGCFYSSNSSLSIVGSALMGNAAIASGGVAAYAEYDDANLDHSRLSVSRSIISDNAAVLGGGFSLRSVSLASFDLVEVKNNLATEGGGFFCQKSEVLVSRTLMDQNQADSLGGGAKIGGGCFTRVYFSHLRENQAPSGGGFYVSAATGGSAEAASLFLHNSTMSGNSGESGGAVFGLGRAARVFAFNSTFTENEAAKGGGVMVRNTSDFLVRDSLFQGNTALIGGGACLEDSAGTMVDSVFETNGARRGGGVHIVSDLGTNNVELERLAFRDKKALDGSSVYWSRKASPLVPFECTNCTHSDRLTRESDAGAFVSTEAIKIGFLAPFPLKVFSTEEIPTVKVGLLDYYSQVARTSPDHMCQLSAQAGSPLSDAFAQDSLIFSQSHEESANGTAAYEGLRLEGKIGVEYEVQVTCFSGLSIGRLVVKQNLTISGCRPGQEPAHDQRSCVDCKFGTFNFDGMACKPCPEGGVCPGRDRLLTESGWWRASNTSERLYMCPKSQSCEAGESAGDGSCTRGHSGPVCALCMESFHEWGNTCRKCSEVSTYIIPALTALGVLFLVTVVLNAAWDPAQTDVAVRINIFVSYCQVIGRLNYYGMDWTQEMSTALGLLDYTNIGAKIISPRCVETGTTFYETYLITMAVPFLIVFLYVCYYLARLLLWKRHKVSKRDQKRMSVRAKAYCCRSVAWLLTLIYISVASKSMEVFGTRLVEDKHYLVNDYSTVVRDEGRGYTRAHKSILAGGAIFLLLYPFGIPLFAFFLLRHAKRNPDFEDAVAFLDCRYRAEFYYWEVLEMARNLLISVIPTAFPQNTALQNVTSQTALVAFLVALLLCQPYKRRSNLFLQCLQLLTVWMLISGGILIKHGNLALETQTSLSSFLIFQMVFTLVVITIECLSSLILQKNTVFPLSV